MSDPSSPGTRRDTPWLRWQLAVAGLIAVGSAFFLAAATTLRLRNGAGGSGFPANLVRRTLELFGFESTFMVAALLMVWCSVWFFTGRFDRPVSRLLRIAGLGFCLAVLVGLRADGSAGGEIGEAIAARLASALSPSLVAILVGIAVVAALLLATDFFFFGHFKRLAEYAATGAAPKTDRYAPGPELDRSAQPTHGDDLAAHEDSDGVEADAVAELEELRLAVHEIEPRAPVHGAAGAAGAQRAVEDEGDFHAALPSAAEAVLPPAHRRREPRRPTRPVPQGSEEVDDPAVRAETAAGDQISADQITSGGALPAVEAIDVPIGDGEDPLPTPNGWLGAVHVESLVPPSGATARGSDSEAVDGGFADDEPSAVLDSHRSGTRASSDPELARADEFDLDRDEDSDRGFAEDFDPDRDPREAEDLEEFDFEIPRTPVDRELEPDAEDLTAPASDRLAKPFADRSAPVADAEHGTDALAPLDVAGAHADSEPESTPAEDPEPVVALQPKPRAPSRRQESLFGAAGADEGLLAEARELVVQFRRASATFLKRRLRVSDGEAMELMQELARRGVIECDDDAAHGRVLVDR